MVHSLTNSTINFVLLFPLFGQFHQISYNIKKPGALTSYLHWSFRSRFLIVLFTEALGFWGFVTFFALCIYGAGLQRPECIEMQAGDRDFESGGSMFIDAFALSWTTFSTVVG